MTSISSTIGSPGSLGSYYAQILAARTATNDSTDADGVGDSGTDTSMSAAEIQALTNPAGTGTSSDSSALSGLLGSDSGSGNTLASLLGSTFTDTNSLFSQISALATGSSSPDASATQGSSTASGAGGTSQQQKIAGLLANMFQTEQKDFLSLFL
jgi:hypothetical protein